MSDTTEPTVDEETTPVENTSQEETTNGEAKPVGLGEKLKKYFNKHIEHLFKKKENMEGEPTEDATAASTEEPVETKKDEDKITKGGSAMFIGMMIFLFVWVVASIAALVYSLMCFGYSGDTMEKVIGVVIAFFTGPFYFIYYKYSSTYCKANEGIGGRKQGGKKNLSGALKRKGGRK